MNILVGLQVLYHIISISTMGETWDGCLKLYDDLQNKVLGIRADYEVDFSDVVREWESTDRTEEINKVKRILAKVEKLSLVYLRDCGLKELHIHMLLDIFENVKVTKLSLNENPNISAEGWRLVGVLVKRSEITKLYIKDCGLNTELITEFIQGLDNAMIQELDIGFNRDISAEGWRLIGVLVKKSGITGLSIYGCGLNTDVLTEFIQALDGAKIQKLDVGYNSGISAESWRLIGMLVKTSEITCLDIQSNGLNTDLLTEFIQAYDGAKIKELNIGSNPGISAEGWRLIGTLVKKSEINRLSTPSCGLNTDLLTEFIQSSDGAKMVRLDICSNSAIDAEGWFFLGKFIASCGLKELEAWCCNLTSECLTRFVQGLGDAKLDVLDLSENGKINIDALLTVLPHVNEQLDFLSCGLDDNSLLKLRDKLRSNNLANLEIIVMNSVGEAFFLTASWESPTDNKAQMSELEAKSNEISQSSTKVEKFAVLPTSAEELNEIKQHAETQLSITVTKVQQIGPEGGNITLNGCNCRLPEQAAESATNVSFSVKMNSSGAPLGYTGISSEVSCKTSQTTARDIIITVPLHTIPEESTEIKIACKKNENSIWEVLNVKPKVKRRSATFSFRRSGIFRAVMNCMQRWKADITHHAFFDPKKSVFCDMTCTTDESTAKKCIETLNRMGFCKISRTEPEKMTLRKNDEMMCEYSYNDTLRKATPFHRVVLKGSGFSGLPYFHNFFVLPIRLETADPLFHYILTLGLKTREVQFFLSPAVDSNPEPFELEPAAEIPPPTPVYNVCNRVPLIEVTPSTQEFYERRRNNKEVYPIGQNSRKGKVLIINNKFRRQEDERLGSEVDVGNLEALWRNLGFDVQVENDLTAYEMRQHYTEFATNAKDVSVVVLIIMTHGGKRVATEFFLGEDRSEVSSNDVIFAFSSAKSPHLKGIPKVFIFQACRGDETDAGLEIYNVDMDNRGRKYPERSDMLIVYPSQSGYVSFRNRETGSWMMNAVTDVFMRHAHNKHVLDMLTKVNAKIAEMQTMEGHVQMSNQLTYLTKDLYLFPGWPR